MQHLATPHHTTPHHTTLQTATDAQNRAARTPNTPRQKTKSEAVLFRITFPFGVGFCQEDKLQVLLDGWDSFRLWSSIQLCGRLRDVGIYGCKCCIQYCGWE